MLDTLDVVTASESSLLGTSDAVQLEHAVDQGRVIFSFNRGDYMRLHTEWLRRNQHHAGIIVSDQIGTSAVLRRLLRLIDEKTADEMCDWLEFLSNWR